MEKTTIGMETTKQPLLIYDGKCDFCFYWANYWQKLTGNKVIYKPYQEVASQFPTIPLEEFQQAVQYVAPDGIISSAAEASFLTLSHAPGKSFWISLYRKIPGFALISEKIYAFIAAHRTLFYRLSLALWGKNYEPPQYNLIVWLFLRLFALIFFAAFTSFGVQALGLIGSQGILPVSDLINAAQNQLGVIRYWVLPMLFWLNSSDFTIQATCWCGAVLSLMLFFKILPRISLLLMYVLYTSLLTAGTVFMSYQWDYYLLETGILAIILINSQTLGIWLLRLLLFRFILEGGLVKILSGDPTWQHLTTLSYYFLTMPIPSPLAWYAHHLPSSILTAATAAALMIELVFPFLIFFPRKIRFISGYAILLMQSIIVLTGNYNFFNLLTMTLCLALFDDAALRKCVPKKLSYFILSRIKHIQHLKLTNYLTGLMAVLIILLSLIELRLRFISNASYPLIWFYNIVQPLRVVNNYGPFAVITTKRMEIIIEGSDDGVNWHEYSFKYKPGDLYRAPTWNIPHQPRLDWQMWFAALDTPDHLPWFSRFLARLLQNSPPVIALLDNNPFPNQPPLYVRAFFYDYQFTDYDEKDKTGAWWKRRLVGMYFPEVSLKAP